MTLSEMAGSGLFLPKITCASKDELISKFLKKIYDAGYELPLQQEDVLNSIYMREKIGGTLLPSGLSLPHARLADFDGFILALGTPAAPLFHNGIQIHLMSMMISSQTGGPWYLPTLAALTKISRDGTYLSRLCEAESQESFVAILRERDTELA